MSGFSPLGLSPKEMSPMSSLTFDFKDLNTRLEKTPEFYVHMLSLDRIRYFFNSSRKMSFLRLEVRL